MKRRGSRAPWLVAACALFACADRKEAHPERPVVLIGVDGLEWRVLKPLIREGKMPNLRKLVERGAAGYLFTLEPALSPAIWTTIATGKLPKHHRVVDFLDPQTGRPFTSNSRRGRALWNVASEYGLETLCVGWWVTYPAEEIHGYMVAPYSAAGQNTKLWKGNLMRDLEDQTWPRDLIDEIYPVVERTVSAPAMEDLRKRYFGALDLERLEALDRELVGHAAWSIQADEAFTAVATHVLAKEGFRPDLTMVYLGGPDVSSHRFWRYKYPEEYFYEVPAEPTDLLKGVIDGFYVQADRMIGEVLAAAPADANVIICSDHGFHAVATRQPDPTGLSGHHKDGPAGVVILAGPDVRPVGSEAILDEKSGAEMALLGRVAEVAPVVHHLLGIPLARHMEIATGGSLMRNALKPELFARRPAETTIESHDEGFREPSTPAAISEEAVENFMDWLEELGYVGAGGGEFRQKGPSDGPAGPGESGGASRPPAAQRPAEVQETDGR